MNELSMIIPNEKIKIFISSKSGEQKYDIVRTGLRTLIESTGLAITYVFEAEEASSIPAGRHYLYELEDSHLCIFLIDNKDGIPDGVQKEIDVANKHSIKSLYYFCTEYSIEETPLQKSLKGAQYAKSKTVNSFKDLLTRPAKALLDEIINVYKQYGKGRLDWVDTNYSQEGASVIQGGENILTPVSKSVLSNIDKCKNYFSQFIFEQEINVEKTSLLDACCCNFLPVIFENKSILDFNANLFLQELKIIHSSEKYFTVIEKRWNAVQSYYQGNTSTCVNFLNEALNNAKISSLPEWFIQDILIDLRNITSIHEENQGNFSLYGDAQKELDKSNCILYYPLVDRFDSSLYEKCLRDEIKERTKSPYTVTIGYDLTSYTDLLASKFIVATINGSITQMLILYSQIRNISYHLISRFSNWNFRLLMLETTVVNGGNTDIDGVIRRYDDILCKMNATDAKKVYDFSCCRPIEYQKFISNLEAFRVIGYFLSDDDFRYIWGDLKRRINKLLTNGKPNIYIGQRIFSALSGNIHRIDANSLAEICNQTIEKGFWRFYAEMFNMLATPIELSALSPEMKKRLLDNIISIVSNDIDVSTVGSLKKTLCAFKNKYQSITELLDNAVKQYMPQFYANEYRLETYIDNKEEMPIFLQKCINIVDERNKTQGKNGFYEGYMDDPLYTIRYLIEYSKVSFDPNQLNKIFKLASEWLLNTVHSINEKSSAMKLIVSLSRKHKEILQSNHDLVLKLQENKEIVASGRSSLTNLSDISLRLSSLFMFYCFGEKIWMSLIEVLAEIKNDESLLIHTSKTILHFFEQCTPKELDFELITILLQFSLLCCREDNVEIRWNAINSLLILVHDDRCSAVACNQLVKMMDIDNLYIKNCILRHIEDIKDIDKPTYDYILQKTSLDTNFVVRKVYSEIIKMKKTE